MAAIAKSLFLKSSVGEGLPGPEHFRVSEIDPFLDLNPGDILVKLLVISADPSHRIMIKPVPTGYAHVKQGERMSGFVAGKVMESRNSNWVTGDLFGAYLPFTTIQVVTSAHLSKTLIWKLTNIIDESNISYGIGIFGMPGSTAYGGLVDVLAVKEGQTLFVSGAAGAVGSMVGMIAKNVYNCTVIGSCGGPEKCNLIKTEFGFDHAIDYKTIQTAEELQSRILEFAPKGIDMYFDNVGGMHLEAAYNSLAPGGRIAICGGISGYNEKESPKISINPMAMIGKGTRMEGFMCVPWLTGVKGKFLEEMVRWHTEGKIIAKETIFEGIEQWPVAFNALFVGRNIGKVVVRV